MIQRSLNKILLFTYNAIILTHLIKKLGKTKRIYLSLLYRISFFSSSSPGCSLKKQVKHIKNFEDKRKTNI